MDTTPVFCIRIFFSNISKTFPLSFVTIPMVDLRQFLTGLSFEYFPMYRRLFRIFSQRWIQGGRRKSGRPPFQKFVDGAPPQCGCHRPHNQIFKWVTFLPGNVRKCTKKRQFFLLFQLFIPPAFRCARHMVARRRSVGVPTFIPPLKFIF